MRVGAPFAVRPQPGNYVTFRIDSRRVRVGAPFAILLP